MKQKNIYCPICGQKLMTVSVIGTIPYTVQCKKCHKIVSYNPETDQVKYKDIPPRTQASGKRIY